MSQGIRHKVALGFTSGACEVGRHDRPPQRVGVTLTLYSDAVGLTGRPHKDALAPRATERPQVRSL